MKLKDIGHWSERWSTPLGTMDEHVPVDGVIVDLSLWGTTIIGLAVQCPDGRDISARSEYSVTCMTTCLSS